MTFESLFMYSNICNFTLQLHRLNRMKHNTMPVYVVQEGRNHLLLPKIVDSFHMKNIQCGIYDQLQPD